MMSRYYYSHSVSLFWLKCLARQKVYSSCFLQSSTVSTQVPALSLGTARDPIRYVAVDAAVVHAVWPHSKITRWRVFTREDARRCRPVFLSYNLIVVLDRGIPQWWLIASLMQLQATRCTCRTYVMWSLDQWKMTPFVKAGRRWRI